MFDLSQKTVLITGAAGNLGKAAAQQFLAAGARLALVDRAPDRLARLYPALIETSEHLLFPAIDLAQPGAATSVVNQVLTRFDRIDVLINTVGGYRGGAPLHQSSPDLLDWLFDINVRPLFYTCQAAIPSMLAAGRGSIINVAARAALAGMPQLAVYSAMKSAVIRLTESIAAELKEAGIRVNCILPGTIDTPQNRSESPAADFSKWVQPEDIANVFLFLASDYSRAISGAAIPVYGKN